MGDAVMSSKAEPSTFVERITELEGDVKKIGGEVGDLKRAFGVTNSKIDELIRSSAEREARRPVGWDKMLDVVGRVGSIAAMTGILILYLAGNQATSTTAGAVSPIREDIAVLKYQIKELNDERRARIARAPTG